MATIADSIRKSSLSLSGISNSLNQTRKSTSAVNNSVGNISRIINTNTRTKNTLYTKSSILQSRRREASKRKQAEDILESKKVSFNTKSGLAFSSRSQGSPLARLVGFLGFITSGWLVENLPTWIFAGKEFVRRVYTIGGSMNNMMGNFEMLLKFFASTLKNSFDAIVRLDFKQFSEGNVAESFQGMVSTIEKLGENFNDIFSIFRTPLTESSETGEQAPGLGDARTESLFPDGQQESGGSYSGPETSSSGVLNPRAAYSYIRQLGVSHIHALGILANIQGESDFRIAADETGRGSLGIGLFQYTHPSRKSRFLQSVPDWKTNWKGQIRYAIKNDENTPAYLKKQFSTPEQAADDFMLYWENPDPDVYTSRRKKHNEFIKQFGSQSYTPSSPSPQTQTAISGAYYRPLPQGSFKGGASQLFGASRDGGKRKHEGVDITESNWNPGSDPRIPVVAIRSGVAISDRYLAGENYMSGVKIEQDDGYTVRYLHMSPSIRPGQRVIAGQRIGRLVSLGKDGSNTHLHIELYAKSKLLDPTNYIKTIERGSAPTPLITPRSTLTASQRLSTSLQRAVITPPPVRPAPITPERQGSNIFVIDTQQPQQSQPTQHTYPSPQMPVPMTINEYKLLNNYMKNKLLLDLAYL